MTKNYESLLKSIDTHEIADVHYPTRKLIPVCYDYSLAHQAPLQAEHYLRLTGGGRVDVTVPLDTTIRSTGSFFFLYTMQGEGELVFEDRVQPLVDGTILLFDGNMTCRLRSVLLPWSFRLYFLERTGMQAFLPFLPQCQATTSAKSPLTAAAIEELSLLPAGVDLPAQLRMQRLLTDILTEICLSSLPREQMNESAGLPAWLHDLYDYIHDCDNRVFSLADLEAMYGVSRYRLCREYNAAYHVSPLKDFNHVRMQRAKKMLLSTSLQVQEISNNLGYENINHFIHLFKSETGLTPGAFRLERKEQNHKA